MGIKGLTKLLADNAPNAMKEQKHESYFLVYAVASEDMDSLTFGAPIFLHHLMDPISRKVPVMEFEISKIPDNRPYSEARLLLKGPIVSTEEQPEIKWTAPNEEGLISFLVDENGFNIDRVTNVWLLSSVMCWR